MKSQWHNRTLNKNAVCLAPVDTQLSLVSCNSFINEMVGKYKTILVTTEDKITKIMLNRLDKKNAINLVMYEEITQALDEAAKDDSTLTVITGCGNYFSSGNDLKDFSENAIEIMKDDGKLLAKCIHHFVDFPKPLVALVNGPAIGLAASLLGLCNIVYATERANEMLLFNKKIRADEACPKGLVTEVFADSTFQEEVWARLKAYANLPKNIIAIDYMVTYSDMKERNTACALYFPLVQLHTTKPGMQVSQQDFEKAKDQLKLLKVDPGNEVKLKLYALFKQATQGPCNTSKPGMLDFVNKAKWDAWNSLGSLPQESARQQYVNLVSSLVSSESSSHVEGNPPDSKSGYETIEVFTEDNITKIVLNRPKMKNAISIKMYEEIIEALEEAAKDDSVITVLTGNGDYYCSGNDLTNFANMSEGGIEEMADNGAKLLKNFVEHFIDFPKPLIAVVNGPAVGISVTVLGLFDVVYSTDRATFHTPFSNLGQSPEGCSSYVFPKIMGLAKATEMLLFNKKLTAAEACSLGLVTEVFPDKTFQKEVWARLKAYASLPRNSLAISKQILRSVEKEKLHEVNSQECACLKERWLSDECMNAVMSFLTKKSKL